MRYSGCKMPIVKICTPFSLFNSSTVKKVIVCSCKVGYYLTTVNLLNLRKIGFSQRHFGLVATLVSSGTAYAAFTLAFATAPFKAIRLSELHIHRENLTKCIYCQRFPQSHKNSLGIQRKRRNCIIELYYTICP